MTAFGGDSEQNTVCRPEKLQGRVLLVILSEVTPASSPVCVQSAEALLFGEVWACWRDGSVVYALIGLEQALTGLQELAQLRADCGGYRGSVPINGVLKRRVVQ